MQACRVDHEEALAQLQQVCLSVRLSVCLSFRVCLCCKTFRESVRVCQYSCMFSHECVCVCVSRAVCVWVGRARKTAEPISRSNKPFGQNFIWNPNVVEREISSALFRSKLYHFSVNGPNLCTMLISRTRITSWFPKNLSMERLARQMKCQKS